MIQTMLRTAAVAMMTLSLSVTAAMASDNVATQVANMMPKECFLIGKIDMHQVKSHKITKQYFDMWYDEHAKKIEDVLTYTGFNANDIRTVWIGVWGDEKYLVALEGNYDIINVEDSLFQNGFGAVIDHKAADLAVEFDGDKGEVMMAAFLSPTLAIFSSSDKTEKALDRLASKKSELTADQIANVKAMAKTKHVAHGQLMALPEKEVKKQPFLKNFEAGGFHIDLDSAVNMAVSLTLMNEQSAKAGEFLLKGFVGMGALKDKNAEFPEIRERVVEKLAISRVGNTIALASELSQSDFDTIVKAKIDKKNKAK